MARPIVLGVVGDSGAGKRCARSTWPGHDLSPELLTLGSNGAIRQAARVGLVVALISKVAVALELEHGRLGARSRVREAGTAAAGNE